MSDFNDIEDEEYSFTPDEYSWIIEDKQNVEECIEEIYAEFSNMVMSDRVIAADIIEDLKTIVYEYEKYIIIYHRLEEVESIKHQYTIIEGDTLIRIAQNLTGDPTKWKNIYQYNNLHDIKLIPGDVLNIPEGL